MNPQRKLAFAGQGTIAAGEKPARGRVWIVCSYGGLPAEGHRDYRCYQLARALVARGHEVVWWTSSFNHLTKRQRIPTDARSDLPGFEIRLVPSPGYRWNISVGRIWSEWKFGRSLQRLAVAAAPPDTIILAEPARFYGSAVAELARSAGARLVLDVLDLWPELFEMLAPSALRPVARALLAPMYRHRLGLARKAAAIVGVTPDYVDAVADPAGFHGPRHVAYLGNHGRVAADHEVPAAVLTAAQRHRPGQVLVVYAGSLGHNYDVDTLLQAAQRLRVRDSVRWIVAGAGPMTGRVLATAAGLGPGTFTYLGLQDAAVVGWLLRKCDMGLSCYRAGSTVSMPLKAYDYLAAGLPIVNSLGRELGRLVHERGIGVNYQAGDAQSLADAVWQLASDAQLRRACADRAAQLGSEYDPVAQHDGYAAFLATNRLLR